MTKVEFVQDKNILTVYLCGEIDHHGSELVRVKIDEIILRLMPRIVIINFSNVSFMDSSGIGLVLARSKTAESCGASLYVEGTDRQTSRILSLAGIKTIQNTKV